MMKLLNVAVLAGVALGAIDGSIDHSNEEEGLQAEGVHAIKKVVQMLKAMQDKSKIEKADEEVAFAKFNQFCKTETAKLKKSIAKSTAQIAALQSSISKLTEDSKKLGKEIGVLNGQVAKNEADMKARQNTRKREHAANVAQSKDYAESISALGRAVQTMSQQKDVKGKAASLLQVSQMSGISQKTKELIDAYMGAASDSDDEGFEVTAPEANAYEVHGAGIISMMKSMNDDFRAAKTKLDKEEAKANHAHESVMFDLADTVDDAKKDISSKSATKAAKEEKMAKDKKEKASTESVKKEDESTLKNMEKDCSEKKLSFESKQKLRADEIEAVGKAMSIMSSSDVSSFIQSAAIAGAQMMAESLAQLRSSSEATALGKRHAVREFILRESIRLQSRSLSLLAENLQADPFAKVKNMIKNMITHLTKQANEDAEANAFCVSQTKISKATRTTLTESIDSLTASIEDSKSTIMSLTQSNAELSKGIAELNAALAKATKLRTAESKKNKASIKNAQAAVVAVDKAIKVLKDFYKKAAMATGLVQVAGAAPAPAAAGGAPAPTHKKGMKTFGKKYTGNQDSATGVLAMIDVIRSDFADTIKDTTAAEAAANKAYSEFSVESKKNIAMKSKKLQLNEADKAAATKKMTENTKDLKSNQDQLVAAQKYFQKLKAQCTAGTSDYETRTKARAAEIQSLKEAIQMLA